MSFDIIFEGNDPLSAHGARVPSDTDTVTDSPYLGDTIPPATEGRAMTIIDMRLEPDEAEVSAVALVDAALEDITYASIVDANKMRDVLLDIRLALTTD